MPDTSEPASASSNSRNARRRAKSSCTHPPRLLLVADLSHHIGRQLLATVDDQLQIRLPDWRLSVRDLRDIDLTAASTPESLGMDAALIVKGSATAILYRSDRPDTEFPIDQRLAGSLLADILLRRGFRHFLWGSGESRQKPEDSAFALGAQDEMRRADLNLDDHFHSATTFPSRNMPMIAAAIDSRSPASIVTSLAALPFSELAQPYVGVIHAPHWLATSVLDQLTISPQEAPTATHSLPPIPPLLANPTAEIASLPRHFPDSLIADVSARIDELLLQHHATDAAELSAQFGTPRRTLERRFREQLGTSIHREITRRQIASARTHLLSPNVSISTASTLSGYPTTRMLSINFRKLNKLSPRTFQRQHLGAWLSASLPL